MPTLTNKQRSEELYRLAYQCEQNKRQGCNQDCKQCPLYLPSYTAHYTEDQVDIAMIQTSAAIDCANEYKQQHDLHTKNVTVGLVVIGLMCFLLFKCHAPLTKPPTQAIPSEVTRVAKITKDSIFDISGDGKINCIDYAIIFCIGYPKSKIIENKNPITGMNHLFNAVIVENRWVYIEPQSGRRMEDVWGTQYNPRYNQDRTGIYVLYLMMSDLFQSDGSADDIVRKQAVDILTDRMNGK